MTPADPQGRCVRVLNMTDEGHRVRKYAAQGCVGASLNVEGHGLET